MNEGRDRREIKGVKGKQEEVVVKGNEGEVGKVRENGAGGSKENNGN